MVARTHRRTKQISHNDVDNHDGLVTHLEPDILEHEVKRTLGSITMNKPSGGDGIPAELFQILKDDAVKVLHDMSANLEISAVATGLEKLSFHSNPKESQCQRMFGAFPIAQLVKNLPAMQETQVWSLGQADPLE